MIPASILKRAIKPVLIAILALVALTGIYRFGVDRGRGTSQAVYSDSLRVAVHYGDSLSKAVQKARDSAGVAQTHSNAFSGRIIEASRSIKRLNDSLNTLLAQLPKTVYPGCQAYADAVSQCIRVRDSLTAEINLHNQRDSSRLNEIRWLNSGLTDATKRGDSLTVALNTVPAHMGQCKWLFIPCPSRKTALISGLFVGLAGGVYVTHR